jgi:HEAT repeat protein
MTNAVPETARHGPASTAEIEALLGRGTDAIAELVRLLDHPSWSVRRSVIAGLAALGEPAVPLLCTSLRDERGDERRIAATVDTLVASTGEVEGAVIALKDHRDPHVVADVAQILGRRRSARGVDALIELTHHADDNVAVAAIEGLGRVGSRAALDAVLACVESGHFFRTFPAVDVLGRSADPRAVAPLIRLLRDPRYAFEAARALGRTGDRRAVPALAELLAAPQDSAVRVASVALAELRVRHVELYGGSEAFEEAMRAAGSEAVVRRLEQCAARSSTGEKIAICTTLGALRHQAGAAVLQQFLTEPAGVAEAAALALGELGRGADGPELHETLRRADSAARRILLPRVSRLDASNAVVECLSDPDATVRALACDTLGRLGNSTVVAALFKLFADNNARVVHAALGAVQSLGSAETERLALAAARSPTASVRRAAMRVVAYFDYPAAFEILRDTLADADARVREAAIQGLGNLEGSAARDCLLSLAQSPSTPARAASMRALGETSEPDARVIEALRAGADDGDAWVRYFAVQSLGKLQSEAAVDVLIRLLDDPAGQVRVAALEALSHLHGERAMAALVMAAQSSEVDMQRAALLGLSLARHAAALPVLAAACSSADAATRLVAVSAAARFDGPEVVDILARAACDGDENVRSAALGFLSRHQGQRATEHLLELSKTAEPVTPIVAALSAPAPGRVARIARELSDADSERAVLLTSCLSRVGTEEATEALLGALELENAAARRAAVATLLAIGNRQGHGRIMRLAAEDLDPDVRRVCALYLAQ